MQFIQKMAFNNLKPHISDAIKESCYRSDVRLYNIANEVQKIAIFSLEQGVENSHDLSMIIDKTIKDSVELGCDLSVIAKGILIGTFRSSASKRSEAPQVMRVLINEILQYVSKYKGDMKETVEGIVGGSVNIATQFQLNLPQTVVTTREDLLTSAGSISPKLAEEIKEYLSSIDDQK